jgi:hypothetical protein
LSIYFIKNVSDSHYFTYCSFANSQLFKNITVLGCSIFKLNKDMKQNKTSFAGNPVIQVAGVVVQPPAVSAQVRVDSSGCAAAGDVGQSIVVAGRTPVLVPVT